MELDHLTLFSQIVQAHNINCLLVDRDFSNLYKADMELRSKLYSNYDYARLRDAILKHCRRGELLKLKDDFGLILYIFPLPTDSLAQMGQAVCVIAGPVLEAAPDPGEIQKIMFRKKLPDSLFRELQEFYSSIAVPPELKSLESTLITIADHLFGEAHVLRSYPESGDLTLESPSQFQALNDAPSIAINTIEERYEVEDQMLEAVACGDHMKASRYHSLFKTYRITPRTENALINRKNMLIILNTLCRKAVQKGHVHPYYIDELSTQFAIRINQSRSMTDLDAIDNEMIHKYCLLVRNHSMKNYSRLVQRCITYTDFHYAEPLTLSFFADMCHVTKSYLSNLFRKETGNTLTDYIHTVRLRHALVLLNSTTIPIQVVAASCGYSDLNYFIKLFKRENGISPKQYRVQMNRNENALCIKKSPPEPLP